MMLGIEHNPVSPDAAGAPNSLHEARKAALTAGRFPFLREVARIP